MKYWNLINGTLKSVGGGNWLKRKMERRENQGQKSKLCSLLTPFLIFILWYAFSECGTQDMVYELTEYIPKCLHWAYLKDKSHTLLWDMASLDSKVSFWSVKIHYVLEGFLGTVFSSTQHRGLEEDVDSSVEKIRKLWHRVDRGMLALPFPLTWSLLLLSCHYKYRPNKSTHIYPQSAHPLPFLWVNHGSTSHK